MLSSAGLGGSICLTGAALWTWLANFVAGAVFSASGCVFAWQGQPLVAVYRDWGSICTTGAALWRWLANLVNLRNNRVVQAMPLLFDVHPDHQDVVWPEALVRLLSTGVLESMRRNTRPWNSDPLHKTAVAFYEEGQQFGPLTEVLAVLSLTPDAFRVWSGDVMQTPGGVQNCDAAHETRQKVVSRRQGLRMVQTGVCVPSALLVRALRLVGHSDHPLCSPQTRRMQPTQPCSDAGRVP